MYEFKISSSYNDGYPYVADVAIPSAFELIMPYPKDLWQVSANYNDGYPYRGLQANPYGVWTAPYLLWTAYSDFDIVRDFGRISNNIAYLKGTLFSNIPLKTEWHYTDMVYRNYVQDFIDNLNALIDVYNKSIPHIKMHNSFDYVILYDIEAVCYTLKTGLAPPAPIIVKDISLYADDVLNMIDWMV